MGGGSSASGKKYVEESPAPVKKIEPPPLPTKVEPASRQAWAEPLEIRPKTPGSVNATQGLVLAADVGGTNSRFMLYQVDLKEEVIRMQVAPGTLLLECKYANIHFGQFADVVEAFLNDAKKQGVLSDTVRPEVACLAVAGVAQQNQCRLTNLDWLIDGPKLSEQFGIPTIEVINDFVGQGYGVLTLSDSEVIHLAGPSPARGSVVACVGAGTGLGQCFLAPAADGEYQCFPSEGGHAEFAPRGAGNDETQIDMLRYLKVKFSGWNRISFERVVSGKGICNVYEFLAYKSPHLIDKGVHEQHLCDRSNAGIIAKNATDGSLCQEALRIFADCYGCVCGTFALQVMPFGGLYLTGGVTQKLQNFLQTDGSFLGAYLDKGRVSPMLQDIPLFFVKGDDMGQRGAHLRAVRLLHHYRAGLVISTETRTDVHLAPPRDATLASLLQAAGGMHRQDSVQFMTPVKGADEE